jgi:hypothetical protein
MKARWITAFTPLDPKLGKASVSYVQAMKFQFLEILARGIKVYPDDLFHFWIPFQLVKQSDADITRCTSDGHDRHRSPFSSILKTQ